MVISHPINDLYVAMYRYTTIIIWRKRVVSELLIFVSWFFLGYTKKVKKKKSLLYQLVNSIIIDIDDYIYIYLTMPIYCLTDLAKDLSKHCDTNIR